MSYGAAVVLVTTGVYAMHLARRSSPRYLAWALAPIFFGMQQASEGRVWQMVDAGDAAGAVPYALEFLFFSHFFWLWWIPLASYLVETATLRRRVFLGVGLFGLLAGGLVYFTVLFNADWLSVTVREFSIRYDISSPYRGSFPIRIKSSVLYGLIVLVPLLWSSHRHIKVFGVMVALSMVVTSEFYGHAYVSIWCFFAAVLSLYLVFMIRSQVAKNENLKTGVVLKEVS